MCRNMIAEFNEELNEHAKKLYDLWRDYRKFISDEESPINEKSIDDFADEIKDALKGILLK